MGANALAAGHPLAVRSIGFSAACGLILWTAGCVSLQRIQVRYERLVPEGTSPAVAPVTVQLWDRTPSRALRRIGRIEAQARRPRGDLERALQERAAAAGGQAIIELQQSEREDAALPGVLSLLVRDIPPLRRLRGTVVVFTEPHSGVHDPENVDAGGAP